MRRHMHGKMRTVRIALPYGRLDGSQLAAALASAETLILVRHGAPPIDHHSGSFSIRTTRPRIPAGNGSRFCMSCGMNSTP